MKLRRVPEFELWLEVEELGDPDAPANRPTKNFCNATVTLADGRRYALNIWTFDFLPLARHPWPYEEDHDGPKAKYVLPPDLFVERLDRETILQVVSELFTNGEMLNEWLCEEYRDEYHDE